GISVESLSPDHLKAIGDFGGLLQGFSYGAIFLEREIYRPFYLILVEVAIQFIVRMYVGKKRGNGVLFALAGDCPLDVFQRLLLLLENIDDIYRAASRRRRQQHLHGPHALVGAANVGRSVHVYDVSLFVGSFHVKAIIQPLEFYL